MYEYVLFSLPEVWKWLNNISFLWRINRTSLPQQYHFTIINSAPNFLLFIFSLLYSYLYLLLIFALWLITFFHFNFHTVYFWQFLTIFLLYLFRFLLFYYLTVFYRCYMPNSHFIFIQTFLNLNPQK